MKQNSRLAKTLAVLLSLMLIVSAFTALPITATAATAENSAGATSGKTGSCKWTLDDGVLTISGNGAMANYTLDLDEVQMLYCTNPWGIRITKIIIEDGVTSIGDYAFYQCSRLSSVTIPDSVKSIGSNAFYECGLKSIDIPDSVNKIGNYAFYGCTALNEINIPDSVKNLGGMSLNNTGWYSNQPEGMVYAGNIAYKWKGTVPSRITLKDGTKAIAGGAFGSCDGLNRVTLPDSVEYIGASAFRNCDDLTSVVIGDGVTEIGEEAFYRCSKLLTVNIGSGLKNVAKG